MTEKNDRSAWLKGPSHPCAVPPPRTDHAWRLVLLGAPGVGKGTQAEILRDRLGACHLSTGDVFRAAKSQDECERSPAMNDALGYMKRGDLVPDSTVLQMIRERAGCLRCQGGFLLDGFPRTLPQALALQDLFKTQDIEIDAVLSYDLPLEEVVSRIGGRRTCSQCKAVYHVSTLPPQKEGVCDRCGGALIQREDDRPESVRVRMEAYEKSTAPLIQFYKQLGLLVSIPATGTPEEIAERSVAALRQRVSMSNAQG